MMKRVVIRLQFIVHHAIHRCAVLYIILQVSALFFKSNYTICKKVMCVPDVRYFQNYPIIFPAALSQYNIHVMFITANNFTTPLTRVNYDER